ncbi:MAG: hypothetical protein ACLQJR_13975 [Stellaceae bacterium]
MTPCDRRGGGRSRLVLAATFLAAGAASGCQHEPTSFADPADGAGKTSPAYQMPQPPDPYHLHPFNTQAG